METIYSEIFDVSRGVVQGDIISPILFILALDQLFKAHDVLGTGVKWDSGLQIRVLGYADDAALLEPEVDVMTERLTSLADAAKAHADMEVSMPKTFSQHVERRDARLNITTAEATEAQSKFKYQCDFCTMRFKSRKAMYTHRKSCIHQYDTTEEVFVVEAIVGVFGWLEARWFLVKYEGYVEPEWSREHLLRRDGCHAAIRDFWISSGLSPEKKFYPDKTCNRCDVCARVYRRKQDLKAHQTRTGHHFQKQKRHVTKTAIAAATVEKRKGMQQNRPKVKWGSAEADNC